MNLKIPDVLGFKKYRPLSTVPGWWFSQIDNFNFLELPQILSSSADFRLGHGIDPIFIVGDIGICTRARSMIFHWMSQNNLEV